MAYALNANTADRAVSAGHTPRATRKTPTFWTRLMNAMIESRMRSAQIELNRYSRFREELETGRIAVRNCETFERHS